ADAAHCFDLRCAQLLAEIPDVYVDHVRAGIEVVSPDPAEQLLPAENLSGVANEFFGERELPGAEFDVTPSDSCATSANVQSQISVQQLRCRAALVPSHTQPDPREQFVEAEGLAEIVISASLQTRDGVMQLDACGEHDHGHPRSRAAQLLEDAKAIETGQKIGRAHV